MLNNLHDFKVLKNYGSCYKELLKEKIKVISSQLSWDNNKEDISSDNNDVIPVEKENDDQQWKKFESLQKIINFFHFPHH